MCGGSRKLEKVRGVVFEDVFVLFFLDEISQETVKWKEEGQTMIASRP
jgi:hypothetical protein